MASAQELHPNAISRGYVGKPAVDGVFTLLSSVSVAVRFVQRRRIGQVWWDGWAVLGSLVFAFGIMVTAALIATVGGAGYHVATYSRAQLETKICLANNVIYHVSIMLSKASVLFFYSRIFSVDVVVLRSMQVLGAILVANCLAAVCGLVFSNSPVEGQWNLSIASTSIDAKPFWITMGVVNLVLDVILAIPQSRVWKLKLSRQRKIAVSLVFLLGCFVCVATTVRIVYIAEIDVSDVTYTFRLPGIWTCIEANQAIICACLPVIYSLFRVGKRRKRVVSESKWTASAACPGAAAAPRIGMPDYADLEPALYVARGHRGYEVTVQASAKTEQLDHPGPIRVQRAYGVS